MKLNCFLVGFLKKTLNYKGTYFWTQQSYKNFYYCIILFFVAKSKQPFKIIGTNTSLQRYFEQTEKLDLLNCCWWTLTKIQKFATYIGSILTLQPAFVILHSS